MTDKSDKSAYRPTEEELVAAARAVPGWSRLNIAPLSREDEDEGLGLYGGGDEWDEEEGQ